MFNVKMKIFRDSVHGYIQVPEVIVKNIIDSELFQRLRNIEQTSMRTLYPAARHDRFIHSLGVYTLGVQAFDSFYKNVMSKYKDIFKSYGINENWWNKNYMLFSLACLMHDCAHAPFSHTLEFIYDIIKVDREQLKPIFVDSEFEGQINNLSKLNYEMLLTYNSKEFMYDYLINSINDVEKGIGAQHEKLSAILVSKEYTNALNEISLSLINEDIKQEDLEFIARMIIGCTYKKDNTPINSIKNCIISMLNSSAIDVDGLDYIVRDAYNSGLDSWSIDYKRIIESFSITEITVLDDVNVKDLNISGVWLANSSLNNEKWIEGSIEGAAGFKNFEAKDVSCISFESNNNYQEGYINPDANIVESYITSKVNIDHPNRKFDLSLKNTCKLNGVFTGKISGKFLGRNELFDIYNPRIEYNIAFNKTCMSVIQSAIDARNHEYLWVYSHPKVVYNSIFLQPHLLRLSAKFLCCKKNNKEFGKQKIDFRKCKSCSFFHEPEEEIILEILGLESFLNKQDKTNNKFEEVGYIFYRSCDDDLNSLFKSVYVENKRLETNSSDEINEYFLSYFSRKHKRPVWKSFIEYMHFFSPYSNSERLDFISLSKRITNSTSAYKTNYGFVQKDIQHELDKHGILNAVCVKSKLKTKELDSNSTYLIFDRTTVRLCDVLDKSILKGKYEKEFFYIYGDMKDTISYSEIPPIIETLKKLT